MTPQRVLVVGGTAGIGKAVAQAFGAQKARVIVAARHRPKGAGSGFVACDASDPASVRRAVRDAAKSLGGLDVLVFSAGVSAWRRVEAVTPAFWDEMVATNLRGAFFASQAAVSQMRPGASIIHVSSLAGKRGSARNSVYCATKFGLNGIVQSLAKELGPRGIRVNAVCPVYVDTPGLALALRHEDAPSHGKQVDRYLREFAATQAALGRMPTAQEVAATCLFLASSSASAITGQCINVDCGVLPQ